MNDLRDINLRLFLHHYREQTSFSIAINLLGEYGETNERLHQLLRQDPYGRMNESGDSEALGSLPYFFDFCSLLEIGSMVGYFPARLPEDLRQTLAYSLGRPPIIDLYHRRYPRLLVSILRSRLQGEIKLSIEDPAAISFFLQLLDLAPMLDEEPDVKRFLHSLCHDEQSTVHLLLCQELQSPTSYLTNMAIGSEPLRGLSSFMRFCWSLSTLLDKTASLPLLQSVLWHHFSHWFELLAANALPEVEDLIGHFLGWEIYLDVQREAFVYTREAIETLRQIVRELCSNHFRQALRAAILWQRQGHLGSEPRENESTLADDSAVPGRHQKDAILSGLTGPATPARTTQLIDRNRRTLGDTLENAADRRGDYPFLVDDDVAVTYGEVLARVNGLAHYLADLGVRHGDRVAVVLPNIAEMMYSWLALGRLGAVMVPVNPALERADTEPLLQLADTCGIIGLASTIAYYSNMREWRIKISVGEGKPLGAVPFIASPEPTAPRLASRRVTSRDLATILVSSSKAGGKGVLHTHASYVLPAQHFVRWMHVTPQDRFFGLLPLFHMAGQAFATSAMTAGATLVLARRFSVQDFWPQVRRHGVTVVRYLGLMLDVLCRSPEGPKEQIHPLRAVYGGGARPDIVEAFEQRFGVAVVEGYGLTETNTVLRNELTSRRRGTLGQPLPYAQVRIVDEHGRLVAPGEKGEIQVKRNPAMMIGYVEGPEATDASFTGDWFRTRDFGFRDEDGYFWLVSQEREDRTPTEKNLYLQVEEILNRHPAVNRSVVVGVPVKSGTELKAHIMFRPDMEISPGDLVKWCRRFISESRIPRFFDVSGILPSAPADLYLNGELQTRTTTGSPYYDRLQQRWHPAEGGEVIPFPLSHQQQRRESEIWRSRLVG